MIIKRGKGDLNLVYRPCRIDEVYGHDTIKRVISNALTTGQLPHSMLFVGPSGCGKTTFARIVALGLNCEKGPTPNPCCKCSSCKSILGLNSLSVVEVDAGRIGDVATVRRILDELPSSPIDAKYKVAIFDEAHLLVAPSKSEDALLKFLEDTPNHVYIILCTNYPNKLKEVTLNRCKVFRFERLLDKHIYKLLEEVAQFEGFEYKSNILKRIATEADGVPRAALSFLQQVALEGTWSEEAVNAITNTANEEEYAIGIDLVKTLLYKGFKEAMVIYSKLNNVQLETVRMIVCGYLVGSLKKSKNINEAVKFSKAIELFEEPYFNNPKPEHKFINSLFKAALILHNKRI